jgi:hypothetical protein
MKRKDFIRKIIQYLLFGILTGIAVILGSRAVTGNNCSSCPGKGICSGDIDCSKFLSEK